MEVHYHPTILLLTGFDSSPGISLELASGFASVAANSASELMKVNGDGGGPQSTRRIHPPRLRPALPSAMPPPSAWLMRLCGSLTSLPSGPHLSLPPLTLTQVVDNGPVVVPPAPLLPSGPHLSPSPLTPSQAVDNGPVVVYFDASGDGFNLYAGGVYNGVYNGAPDCGTATNHVSEST